MPWGQIGGYLADHAIEVGMLCVLVGGLYFTYRQISEGRKSTYYDFVWTTQERWCAPEFVEAREAIGKIERKCRGDREKIAQILYDYRKKRAKQFFVACRIADYFEALGDLVKKGVLKMEDIEITEELIRYYWEEVFQGYVAKRKKEGKQIYSKFENLYERVCNIHSKRRPNRGLPRASISSSTIFH